MKNQNKRIEELRLELDAVKAKHEGAKPQKESTGQEFKGL